MGSDNKETCRQIDRRVDGQIGRQVDRFVNQKVMKEMFSIKKYKNEFRMNE